ncbi:hypothetical protein VKS41_004048 [Umbelopsis sp. WA50703]
MLLAGQRRPTLNLQNVKSGNPAIPHPSGPPSPTMSTNSIVSSMSWIVDKSPADLMPLLKNAYTALKDKEKDLVLAAEIGKSLLDNNMQLKAKYEDLLHQLSMYQTQPSESAPNDAPVYPTNETETTDASSDEIRIIPSKSTRDAIIDVLETKNAELLGRLESSLEEADNLQKNNKKVTRKLESEIASLKDDLNIAAQKIQELEQINREAAEKQRRTEAEVQNSMTTPSAESYALIGNMFEKVGKLEIENTSLQAAKLELEAKLSATFRDLRLLKDQFENFQFTQDDYDALQEAYNRQFDHIAQLNESLEDHRTMLQKLRERGTSIQTPTPSVFGDDVLNSTNLNKKSLLSELESEWFKDMSHKTASSKSFSGSSFSRMLDFAQATEDSLLSFYNNPTEYALSTVLSGNGMTDKGILDEALAFINRLEEEDHVDSGSISDFDAADLPSYDLYPDCHNLVESINDNNLAVVVLSHKQQAAVSGKMRKLIKTFFRTVWKWCRFAMILTAAVLINVWHGPSSMLIDY